MADAPASGGSSWGTFEIILILVLVIGFLTQLQGGFKSSDTTSPKKGEAITASLDEPSCGLTISRPHSLEKVERFVTLIGQVDGCQWVPTDSVALYAQITDWYGRPVSAYTAIPASIDNGFASSAFSANIYLTTQPTTTKGFLLLVSAQGSGDQTASYRIPLTFSRP